MTLPDEAVLNRRFGWLAMAVLFAFGVYLSILYFGHQVVPNSDFVAFVQTGRSMWSFELPASFKRAPVLGILQVGLSFFVGGQHPELTAGWLLNAILYPILAVLLYLVGRKFLGRAAVWFALLAILNPWLLKWMRHPIAEIPLIFFMVLTFYFILRRSRWCYFFAAVTTMVRYEGAGLILVAFVLDMIDSENFRRRVISFLYSALATLPLALWLLGMVTNRKPGASGGSLPYISNYGAEFAKVFQVFKDFSSFTWQVSIAPLMATTSLMSPGQQMPQNALAFQFPTSDPRSASEVLIYQMVGLTQIVLLISVALAVVYAIKKKQWRPLGLVMFAAIFFALHATRSYTLIRYAAPMGWMMLLICMYGLRGGWILLQGKIQSDGQGRIPRPVTIGLQIFLLSISFAWLISLGKDFSYLPRYCQRSVSIPYVAAAAIITVLLISIFLYRRKGFLALITSAMFTCMLMVSNQFALARYVSNGNGDIEFKELANWYIAHAQPGEKLVTSMPHIVNLYAPKYKEDFIRKSSLPGDTFAEFIETCYKRNITYVAWDSRIGLAPNDTYYKRWKMQAIQPLYKSADVGPFKFIAQIKANQRRYINIFCLQPQTAQSQKKPTGN